MKRFNEGLAVLSLLAGAAVLVATMRYGPGVSPDSAMYVAAARSLLDGAGFLGYDGQPVAFWPPLYPAVLAAFGALGFDVAAVARWLGALVFGLIVFCSGKLFRETLRSPGLAWGATLAVAAAMPLVQVSVKVWSEPLFILFVVLFLRVLPACLEAPSRARLGGLAAVTAAAMLDRYAGAALLLTGAAFLLMRRAWPLRRRLGRALVFGVASGLPLALWLLRNERATGTLTGVRGGMGPQPLPDVLAESARPVSAWLMPPAMPGWAQAAALVVPALLIAAGFRSRSGERPARVRVRLRVALGFTLVYAAFVTAAGAAGLSDAPNGRLLAPLYVPLVFMAALGLEAVFAAMRRAGRRRPALVLAVCAGLWLAYPLASTATYVYVRAKLGGGGYHTEAWQASAMVRWLKTHPPEGVVYSNLPAAAYLFTRRYARAWPHAETPEPGAVVLWFDDVDRAVTSVEAALAEIRARLKPGSGSGTDTAGPAYVPADPSCSGAAFDAGVRARLERVRAFAG
ncbi:ArnT family glycosyltransferase, partial [Rhodocaloribacter sp.]